MSKCKSGERTGEANECKTQKSVSRVFSRSWALICEQDCLIWERLIWVLPLHKHNLSCGRSIGAKLLRRHLPCPMGRPALLGCNPVISYTLALGLICFRRLPCKQDGFRSCFLSKTSAIQAVGTGSIAKGSPFSFSQQVDIIEDGWETFTHQRGSWRYHRHLKCPQTPLCGQLKPTFSPYRQQSLRSCLAMCKVDIWVVSWISPRALLPALATCPLTFMELRAWCPALRYLQVS